MSDALFRALLRPSDPPTSASRVATRYQSGRVSAYLQQAEQALVAAEAMTMGPRRPQDRDVLVREIQRAAASICKAIRSAHGLSPTREQDLRRLVFGDDAITPIPDGPWRERMRGVVMIGALLPESDWGPWTVRVRHLLQDARHLTPPQPAPKRFKAR